MIFNDDFIVGNVNVGNVVFVDDGFSEMLKWSLSGPPFSKLQNILLESSFPLVFNESISNILKLAKPDAISIFALQSVKDVVVQLENELHNKLEHFSKIKVFIYTSTVLDVNWESDGYQAFEKILDPIDCTILHFPSHIIPLLKYQEKSCEAFILSSQSCRPLFPLTLHGIGCWGAVENTSIEDMTAEDVPARSRALLKLLAGELAGALVFNLGMDVSGSVFALGQTSSLLGHTLQPIVSSLVKVKSQQSSLSLSSMLPEGMTLPSSLAPDGRPPGQPPLPLRLRPASLVLIDRTADLASALSACLKSPPPLAHRILANLPRQHIPDNSAGGGAMDSRQSASALSPAYTDVALESVIVDTIGNSLPEPSLAFCNLPKQPSSILSSLGLHVSPSLFISDAELRRAVYARSEDEARQVLCTALERRVVEEGGALPPPKKRGLGAAVLALVQALQSAPGSGRESEMGTDAVSGRSLELLSPALAVIEAMRRSAVLPPQTTHASVSARLTFDERARREREVDEVSGADGVTAGVQLLIRQLQMSPNKSPQISSPANREKADNKVKEEPETDAQHTLLNLVRLVARFGLAPMSTLGALWTALADYLLDHCSPCDLRALGLLQEALVTDIESARGAGTEQHTRQRLRLELSDLLGELSELLREIDGISSAPRLARRSDGDHSLGLVAHVVGAVLHGGSGTAARSAAAKALAAVGVRHVDNALLKLARAGLGLLTQGLGSFGLSGSALGSPQSQPWEHGDVAVFVLGGLTFAEVAEVEAVVTQALSAGGPGGASKQPRVVLGSTSLVGPDQIFTQVFSTMKCAAQK